METRRISGFQTERLLAPEQALSLFFATVSLVQPVAERVPLSRVRGRVLAHDVTSGEDVPAAPRSTMDGFAVRAADTPGELRIDGAISMGTSRDARLAQGTAVRIPTGGVLPSGADAVVPIESVQLDGENVRIGDAIPLNDCVSERGSDIRAGEMVLPRGRILGAAEMGVLATLGTVHVSVWKRPVIAVMSTGDELVDASATPLPGQIRDSNRWVLAAHLERLGAEVRHIPTPPDEPSALEAALRKALEGCDGVVLSGGSSVGERDLTPDIVSRLGDPGVVVHGLRVKPGKPTVLGAVGAKPVIGLPGNPASALTILDAVASPIIAALTGADAHICGLRARLTQALSKRKGWTWFVPVQIDASAGEVRATPLTIRSSQVSLLARAAGYATFGELAEHIPAGTEVDVRLLQGAF
ncbi:MAG: molybdopterin molybdotransferase MoeA [Candidatus Eremiobacteraeota bacterium]|nr:molybdopterin molybdotransferase MoeA [Candidatus Eremiobacteraeota bacterium]